MASELGGDLDVAGRAVDPGQRVERDAELRAQRVHVHPGLSEKVAHRGALLVEQGRRHVHRFQELVVMADREALGVRERHLELGRELVRSHCGLPSLVPEPVGAKSGPAPGASIPDKCGSRDRNQAVCAAPDRSRPSRGSRLAS